MRARSMFWLALPCLAALVPGPALGQQAESARAGFGLSLGLGVGSTGVTCEGCQVELDDRESGISGYLRMGGYTSNRFFVGVEGTGWMKNDEGIERRIAAASLVFMGYPSASSGFFLRSGFGGMRAVIEDDFVSMTGTGVVWSVGAGFDIPLGTGAALTPYVTYLGGLETVAHINEVSTDIILNPNIFQMGMAVSIQ